MAQTELYCSDWQVLTSPQCHRLFAVNLLLHLTMLSYWPPLYHPFGIEMINRSQLPGNSTMVRDRCHHFPGILSHAIESHDRYLPKLGAMFSGFRFCSFWWFFYVHMRLLVAYLTPNLVPGVSLPETVLNWLNLLWSVRYQDYQGRTPVHHGNVQGTEVLVFSRWQISTSPGYKCRSHLNLMCLKAVIHCMTKFEISHYYLNYVTLKRHFTNVEIFRHSFLKDTSTLARISLVEWSIVMTDFDFCHAVYEGLHINHTNKTTQPRASC
jgi:hypothetical protein